ncbi:MAG: MFS transporter [Chloroflexi bacterium]|nr:MFS transporter [Chloroflexota bacterium]
MLKNFERTYRKFDKNFWVLVAASFIDTLGGSLIFPFLSLFMTRKFNVGMTEVGTMFLIWGLGAGLLGNTLGGALADKFGRKTNLIFGLIASASSALLMVFIQDIVVFYIVIGIIGIFEDIAGPARQAMIADLVPEDIRTDAYGIMRIVFNLSVTIGPAIGGLMAARSFNLLFIIDFFISLLVAGIVFLFLPETKPQTAEHHREEGLKETFQGYRLVLKDKLFIAFVVVVMLETLMYFNMNSTLSVFLVNFGGITTQQFGYILSLNAGMVVLLQMLFSRLVAGWKPMLTMVIGNILYVIGFSMYGYVNNYGMYLFAMVIITIGEMIIAPVAQSLVAHFAPEEMRGRYMAINAMAWVIPVSIGPLGAGFIMDNFDPRLLWFVAGGIGLLDVIGFLTLHFKAGKKFEAKQNGHKIAMGNDAVPPMVEAKATISE